MDTADRELVARYQRGDVAALDQLVERHQRPLYGYLVNLTRNPTEADDLFQEVWMRVIRKLDGYQDQNFGGWLMRIAHNLTVDRIRRRKPEISVDAEDERGGSLGQTLAAAGISPHGELAARDLGARIATAVATLPPEQKAVFVMRVQAELPFREIARIQGVSINTALARMQYALGKLRALLQADYEGLGAAP